MELNEKIVHLRKQKGISQTELAKALGVKISRLSMWENGKRNINLKHLVELADYFNVSIAYFVGEECRSFEQYKGKIQEVISKLQKLNSDERLEEVNKYINYVLWKQKKEERNVK